MWKGNSYHMKGNTVFPEIKSILRSVRNISVLNLVFKGGKTRLVAQATSLLSLQVSSW